MSEITAMDKDMPDTLDHAARDEQAVVQGLVDNKAEQQTPGEMLRAARIRRDHSVADLCAQTMLSKHTIEALEDDRFEDLSQPVFARGYYRKCAKVLDMDGDALMAAYARSGGARRAETPTPIVGVNVVPADVTPDRRRTFGAFFLILILLVAAFAVYLFWSERNSNSTTAARDGEGVALTTPWGDQADAADEQPSEGKPVMSPLAGPLGSAAADTEAGSSSATPGSDRAAADDNDTESTALPAALASGQGDTDGVEDGAPATADASGGDETAASDGVDAEDGAKSSVADTALTLQFSKRSWVSVHDATGKQLLVGIYEDTSRTLDGQPPYKLVLGYGPGVDVRLGDKKIDFKVAGNQTARFSVGSKNP